MKKIIKYIMAIVVASSAMFYSCETVELELVENPNGLSEDQADPDLLLNAVQLGYLSNMGYFNGQSSSLTRLNVFFSRDYFAGVTPISVNGVWTRTYSTNNAGTRGMIPNTFAIEALNATAGDGSLDYQEAVSKTLLAHNMMLLVDFIGDVPFSEANNPDEFPAPSVDSGASVYTAALALLDEAEALFAGGAVGTDLFYNTGNAGNGDQYVRLINTIRMKAALTTGDLATFTAIEAGGNFISSNADDFQYTYVTNDVNPDGRHPDYANDYTPSGANIYQSNWLMNQMLQNDDPRIRYYFYRQNDCTPGATCNPAGDGQTLSCSLIAPPVHYVNPPNGNGNFGDIFCFLEDGYWGRPHGDDQGTPPDNFFRTAVGVYPAAGFFDDDSFSNVGLGLGGGGAGIEPFILSSYVDFMRAEVQLAQNNAPGAAALIESALTKSTDKVLAFAGLDVNHDTDFEASAAEVTAFIDAQTAAFNAAGSVADQWNILAENLFVTQYGGGAETYNFYRRTGFPTTLVPNLEPNPGPFVRSVPYPANEVVANPNIMQKPNQSVQVFWDTNPPSAVVGGFPLAN